MKLKKKQKWKNATEQKNPKLVDSLVHTEGIKYAAGKFY